MTTGVDAGSTGWGNYQALKTYIVDPSETQIFAFVHLAATGLTSLTARVGELQNLALCDQGRGIGEHPQGLEAQPVEPDDRGGTAIEQEILLDGRADAIEQMARMGVEMRDLPPREVRYVEVHIACAEDRTSGSISSFSTSS